MMDIEQGASMEQPCVSRDPGVADIPPVASHCREKSTKLITTHSLHCALRVYTLTSLTIPNALPSASPRLPVMSIRVRPKRPCNSRSRSPSPRVGPDLVMTYLCYCTSRANEKSTSSGLIKHILLPVLEPLWLSTLPRSQQQRVPSSYRRPDRSIHLPLMVQG